MSQSGMAKFLCRCVLAVFAAAVPGLAGTVIPGTTCAAFPADSWWHADISALPLHARSAAWMSHMSPTAKLHPDFGPSYGEIPVPYGIPITVVPGTHALVPVTFSYAAQSDNLCAECLSNILILSLRTGSNRRPTDYKSVALPAELQRLTYLQ